MALSVYYSKLNIQIMITDEKQNKRGKSLVILNYKLAPIHPSQIIKIKVGIVNTSLDTKRLIFKSKNT